MLVSLVVRDIVLIRQLHMNLKNGLSALTGETGAGKSILLDALSLALGGRGDGQLVRLGCETGEVAAVFEINPNHPVNDILQKNGLNNDNDNVSDIILRRTQTKDGKTRAYVNDKPVGVGILKEVGNYLVEIHGQHEERALVDPTVHRNLVDAFGGLQNETKNVGGAYREWKDATKKYQEAHSQIEEITRDAEFMRAAVRELSALNPKKGEEVELENKRRMMLKSQKVAGDIQEAFELLGTSPAPFSSQMSETQSSSATPFISEVVALTKKLERKDPELFASVVESLDTAIDALGNADDELNRLTQTLGFDQTELEITEERLFSLKAASRKYNVPVDELDEYCSQVQKNLEALDVGEHELIRLQKEITKKREELTGLASGLSDKRRKAAKKLREAVVAELPALRLEGADFLVEQVSEEITTTGTDKIEFYVQTNPTTRSGPLKKVASGGELSRFMLALKVALAGQGSAPTLVFDEVDTGAGGAMADAIGIRLSKLANYVQVLCVTHAPQVAAKASTHFNVTKTGANESRETDAQELDPQQKLEEIARMLSGAEITKAARAAAAQLISVGGCTPHTPMSVGGCGGKSESKNKQEDSESEAETQAETKSGTKSEIKSKNRRRKNPQRPRREAKKSHAKSKSSHCEPAQDHQNGEANTNHDTTHSPGNYAPIPPQPSEPRHSIQAHSNSQ